jgi:NADH dehydrogenase FAD-containing subunit
MHIVIIGAGYAGMLAAIRLARQTRRDQAQITLVNAGDHFIERIRLHEWLTHKPLRSHRIDRLLRGTGVRFINGCVTALDPIHKTVQIESAAALQAGGGVLNYDRLIYALGSHTNRWRVPGVAEHAHVLEGASGEALRAALPALAERNARLVVVGGGLTGIEAATELAGAYPGLRVTLVTEGVFGADLSGKGQAHLRQIFARQQIEVIENTPVECVEAGRLLTASGGAIPFDACMWAAGFIAPPLAREAGLTVNGRGQIHVDESLRALGQDSIYVAGDAAAVELPWGALRMGCVSAMPMGAYVADRLSAEVVDKPTKPFRFGFVVRCISLGRRDGLVQQVGADDTPQERIVTGWMAALVKEFICQYTARTMTLERVLRRFYTWSQPDFTTRHGLTESYKIG